MMNLEGEITDITVPPNKAEIERLLSIWVVETENEIELTLDLEVVQKYQFQVGDKLSIQIDKKPDFDKMARHLVRPRTSSRPPRKRIP